MSDLTIEGYWRRRLRVERVSISSLVPGWSFEASGLPTFKEAPLARSDEFGMDGDPDSAPIVLVSAPGAVGKSTLARQIAFATGALLVDLAKADPVGANTLSGGLAKSKLFQHWSDQRTALLVDGLDEARLRVTQGAFEAFLSDVATLAAGRTIPTVLFGRTGAIQDAWLLLSEHNIQMVVLEIGYYGPEASVDFAEARLRAVRPSAHAAIERKALEALLQRLRGQTEGDGDRFAGYAPVLQAVAERVANETNASALLAQIEQGAQPVTLETVITAILERERGKLTGLPFENAQLASTLYTAEEQLDRLVARVYHLPPPALPPMSPRDTASYSSALETWVAEHPFLDGSSGTSSAVFEAKIAVRALRSPASREPALIRELTRGAAANPFLSEFYAPEGNLSDIHIPPEHIGVFYASLRARLSLGDTASLVVEGREDGEEEEALRAEVEITLARRGEERPRLLQFQSEQTGPIRLGPNVDDVDIVVPHARVQIGPGTEAIFVAPVSIQCNDLVIDADKVIAESPSDRQEAAVYLEAATFNSGRITSVPIVRGNVSLAVSWPGASAHPWQSFATQPSQTDEPMTDEALRRLRKIVIAFRSHKRNRLARYRGKIEHERMMKGPGKAVLNQMLLEDILSLEGQMYFLDPDKLSSEAGTNYQNCMKRQFDKVTVDFARRALASAE